MDLFACAVGSWVAQKASEVELRFEVRSIVDGTLANLDEVADASRAARMKVQANGLQAS